jgi:hypothetical protein
MVLQWFCILTSDRSKLFYYSEPEIPANLNSGFPERFIKRDAKIESLDALVDSLREINLKSHDHPYIPQFCTCISYHILGRGIMTKFFCVPYSNDSWELGLTLFNGTIYIEEHKQAESSYGNDERSERFTY